MISYYELLGLIKDGKQPDKVKYDDNIYIWNEDNYLFDLHKYITDSLGEVDMFDKNIEIIEEKPKKIKKLAICDYEETFNKFELDVIHSINRLIGRVNYLLDRDNHE